MRKLKSSEMELVLSSYFNSRTNLIVPNVSWGLNLHECDLLIVTPAGYAWEVEIKTTKYDLIRDGEKIHKHGSKKIKYLYFAIPEYLLEWQDHIPVRAGILVVKYFSENSHGLIVKKIRDPEIYSQYKLTDKERYQVARLGAMRIWDLKRSLKNVL